MSTGKTLTDEELDYISKHSGIDSDVIRSWHKDFLQACPKGKMDKKHFYKFYKMLRSNNEENLSKITDHVFNCFDKDKNGYLDFSEFLIAYSSTSNGEPRKKLEFVFTFYDKDRDGTIKEKEFLKVVESMYEFRGKSKKEYPPEKLVKDIFDRIDHNGDKSLSKEEFIEGCLKHKQIIELISPFEII